MLVHNRYIKINAKHGHSNDDFPIHAYASIHFYQPRWGNDICTRTKSMIMIGVKRQVTEGSLRYSQDYVFYKVYEGNLPTAENVYTCIDAINIR